MILEAMKMEHTIKAPGPGRVARICHQVGEQVGEGAELIQFEAEP
ncbi:MAG TPA: acetyl-CoA carboxylase biotin carboxyl carrier protein subunit [Burkholderiales bacterium]|nr:acetyl-CoA carboxylase biotin carboxyl carrier protein subunit [Burkholderiales bacterium]